jgi:hypothetical protein
MAKQHQTAKDQAGKQNQQKNGPTVETEPVQNQAAAIGRPDGLK